LMAVGNPCVFLEALLIVEWSFPNQVTPPPPFGWRPF
jgi:hypothetical protein